MDEKERLKILIDEHGYNLVWSLFIDGHWTLEQMEESFTEKKRRENLMEELK